MTDWPVPDGDVRWNDLLDTCLREGPQTVTRDGQATAVLVPLKDWTRLNQGKRYEHPVLLAPEPRIDDWPIPPRGRGKWRTGTSDPFE